MCGIIGYIGNKKANDILLIGLKKLEYRGYDSAGIAISNKGKIQIIKSVGKVEELERKVNSKDLIASSMGIAHTRWATNGESSFANAHPHKVGKVTLVHNGIIENADILKEKLEREGYDFKSDTDSEVVAALLDSYLKENNEIKAINKTIKKLIGSYALAIIIDNSKEEMYAVRKDSPLILAPSVDGNFLASDIPAFTSYTNKYILLDANNIAKITTNNIEIYNEKLEKIKYIINEVLVDNEDTTKHGYSHYMLKEINEETVVLDNLIKTYIDNLDNFDLASYEQIHIVACGSAMYAGMIGKYLLTEYAKISTLVEVASEYRYNCNIYDRKTLVIVISQSGETADTIAALRKAKDEGITVLAIVNRENSTIAREADKTIYIKAGVEVAVATTKAYILQVLVMSLLSYKTAISKKLLTVEEANNLKEEYKNISGLVYQVINKNDIYKEYASGLAKTNDLFFIGRKMDYAMCLEGSLKMKEISYIHSEAYQAGELKHGTISLIEDKMPVIAIITDEELKEKTISNVKEVLARRASVIIVTTDKLKDDRYNNIVVPAVSPFLQPLLVVPALQLLAFYTALARDCDIDKPRNLAKSVTVE